MSVLPKNHEPPSVTAFIRLVVLAYEAFIGIPGVRHTAHSALPRKPLGYSVAVRSRVPLSATRTNCVVVGYGETFYATLVIGAADDGASGWRYFEQYSGTGHGE